MHQELELGALGSCVVEVLALLANTGLLSNLGTFYDFIVNLDTSLEAESVTKRVKQVQVRLRAEQVQELVVRYVDGESIDALARAFHINRTTVIAHLERNGVPRRKNPRKLTDQNVTDAAIRYAGGLPLATVAREFDVCPRTLRREFVKAGVPAR